MAGKYDQYQHVSEPFSAIVTALTELCQKLLQEEEEDDQNDHDRTQERADLTASVGVNGENLTHLFPSLRPLLLQQHQTDEDNYDDEKKLL